MTCNKWTELTLPFSSTHWHNDIKMYDSNFSDDSDEGEGEVVKVEEEEIGILLSCLAHRDFLHLRFALSPRCAQQPQQSQLTPCYLVTLQLGPFGCLSARRCVERGRLAGALVISKRFLVPTWR